jgi:hypothetical protein
MTVIRKISGSRRYFFAALIMKKAAARKISSPTGASWSVTADQLSCSRHILSLRDILFGQKRGR